MNACLDQLARFIRFSKADSQRNLLKIGSRLRCILKHDDDHSRLYRLAPGRAYRRPGKSAYTIDFTRLHRHPNIGGAFIAGYQAHRQTDRFLENLRPVIRGGAGSAAAQFKRCLGSEPLFGTGDADLLVENAKVVIVTRRSDPAHLSRIELNALSANKLIQNLVAIERSDG